MRLKDALNNYAERGRLSFHTPGHKGRAELLEGLCLRNDLTELPELDTLAAPRGILLEARRRAAAAYGAEETFFLVNGATAGNLAMLLALAIGERKDMAGGMVCVERYAHRSVGSALVLSGLVPHYVAPVIHPDFGLPLGGDVCAYWRKDFLAVHVTCPSYYGTAIDMPQLLLMRDASARETPVLVDQAHGAHWRGELFPENAVALGADGVVHSVHKTLAGLTQSALLHVRGNRLNRRWLAQALEMVQSSSPSYLLMASLDEAVEQGACAERWGDLVAEAQRLRRDLGPIYRVLGETDVGTYGIAALDQTKILINTAPLGVSAGAVAEELRQEYGLEPELWDERNILFVLGVGNRPEDVQRLRRALLTLAERRSWRSDRIAQEEKTESAAEAVKEDAAGGSFPAPPMRLTPREAWLAPRREIAFRDCLGEVAAETIVAYPPGIPLVVAGEEMTQEVMRYVAAHPLLRERSSFSVIDG